MRIEKMYKLQEKGFSKDAITAVDKAESLAVSAFNIHRDMVDLASADNLASKMNEYYSAMGSPLRVTIADERQQSIKPSPASKASPK